MNYLTVKQAAQMMGISIMSVYRLHYTGKIPVTKIGKSTRIPEKALMEYLQKNTKLRGDK